MPYKATFKQCKGLNDHYCIFGFNATYKNRDNVELQFIGRNITDTEYYSPHLSSNADYDYEWPGATFMFRTRIVF